MSFDLSLFSPRAHALLGLDISSSAIKMVELSSVGKNDYRVERYAVELLPKDVVVEGNISDLEAVQEAVKRAWKRMGTSTKNVALALPASAVISKKIVVPAGMRDEELGDLVETEASQYIPFPIDEVNLDYQIIGPAPASPEDMEVLIAASKKERIQDRLAVVEAVGLKATVMDVESYANLTAFEFVARQLPEEGEGLIIALLDVGTNVMELTVLRDGVQIYSREQAFGGGILTQDVARRYGMSYGEAESAKRAASLAEDYASELLPEFSDSLALEASRALQFFFTSTQFSKVDYIVLAGGCAAIPGIDELVAVRTQVSTIVANPFTGMLLSDKVRSKNLLIDAPALMVACGLALRRFDPL